MKIIYKGRQQGKTTELIKMSSENWIYIVCHDKQRVENIMYLARKMNIDIPYPITLSELPIKNSNIKTVLVDDADIILQTLINKSISAITLNKESPNEK